MLYFVAGWGGGGGLGWAVANLNIVKKIVPLHWNQTNLIYITIHLEKVSGQMNLKIILYFLFWLTTKHDDSLFHCPAAHAAAGQGEGWRLQGMAI